MKGGDRLIDTNVLVHAYVFLDAKKHASAREIILPMWHEGGGLTTLQNLAKDAFMGAVNRCYYGARR